MLSGLAMTTQQGAVHVAIIDFLTFHHALCHRLGRMSVLAVFYSGDSISIHFIACICFTDSFFYSAAPSPCWQGVCVLRSGISIPCASALDEIDAKLAGLASFSLQTSVGPIGWRSSDHADADHTEWVRIDLGAEQEIDLIALVPALARGGYNAYEADAFPLRFQIIAGTEHDVEGKVIASFSEQDAVMPRIAPLCIPCPGTRASWIKLEATRLGSAFVGRTLRAAAR